MYENAGLHVNNIKHIALCNQDKVKTLLGFRLQDKECLRSNDKDFTLKAENLFIEHFLAKDTTYFRPSKHMNAEWSARLDIAVALKGCSKAQLSWS